ncbi:hypothetical protein MACH17_18170 [Phaeobacter inhibens]|uniref:hypothetical protein n=1 Tax=Phaeobacter inhibens TaxID=221822 RepID=UPI00276E2273|nr:hypothetical protein [Phaeobacter inhibens]GLO70300.1 hypothetical protein MACH17_18170 [Phaeobacter inhibens]
MTQRGMSDEQLLNALHLRDHDGLTCGELAQRFRVSRGTMIGAMYRIDQDTDRSDPDGNKNGSMKPKWWKR